MSRINQIQQSLKRINQAKFEELCNHWLYLKFNPNSITPYGSVIGKEKTKKGIPDCFFYDQKNNLTFAGYTTQEKVGKSKSFIKKLQHMGSTCFLPSVNPTIPLC